MFNQPFEKRLSLWREFRNSLEDSESPMQDTINFWNSAPLVSIQADPYDSSTWPDAWEIIHENIFCSFVKILAICYTLQLTERFSHEPFEIHITQDTNESQTYYLLIIDNWVIGYDMNKIILKSDLPNSIETMFYKEMPALS